jgi:hypothetical protein
LFLLFLSVRLFALRRFSLFFCFRRFRLSSSRGLRDAIGAPLSPSAPDFKRRKRKPRRNVRPMFSPNEMREALRPSPSFLFLVLVLVFVLVSARFLFVPVAAQADEFNAPLGAARCEMPKKAPARPSSDPAPSQAQRAVSISVWGPKNNTR